MTDEEVLQAVCHQHHWKPVEIYSWQIVRKSIDARHKKQVHYLYTLEVFFSPSEIPAKEDLLQVDHPKTLEKRPIVVGAGPAGLFAAYTLARNGAKPIVIEQGKCVEDRQADVEAFRKQGKLLCHSNVQFGEGGAGTFSDGKLTTGVNHPLNHTVLETFVVFGAPASILYQAKPHIGTDYLLQVIRAMRQEIIRLGGEVWFETKVVDVTWQEGNVTGVTLDDGRQIETNHVILAIGHSARDLFETLYRKGVKMEAKSFSVGVRIEHLQRKINEAQYGTETTLQLPPAEYKLVYHGVDGRTCYTFCMCPGGVVMASSSEEKTIVTNGMSRYARDGKNANSAILVNVTPKDFANESPLAGIYFQKELEEKAFVLGGENYYAPVQRVEDFLRGVKSERLGSVEPTYQPGVTLANLKEILPTFVSQTLQEGILDFDKKLKGFADPDAILTGVETRSSSPVRMVRNENLEAFHAQGCLLQGLYPTGEGAGYAGGIMTAAMDGIKVAKAILQGKKATK